MTNSVVMIRGINVGKAKRVAMGDLRTELATAGFPGASTILASGNVVIEGGDTTGDELASVVERVLADRFDVDARCLARSAAEIDEVIANDPLADVATDGSKYLAIFLSDVLPDGLVDSSSDASIALDETMVLADRVIYQWCPDGTLAAPPVGDLVMKHSDLFVTARNWNTVVKIRDRLAALET